MDGFLELARVFWYLLREEEWREGEEVLFSMV